MQYNYQWDLYKSLVNLDKHGVSFELASEVFNDPMALTIFDDNNSTGFEDRWITIGQVRNKQYLVVVHTYCDTEKDAIWIRLISARYATKQEVKQYKG